MADLFIFKSVAALPTELAANGIYAVRAGVGFDLYIANSDGTAAHKMNGTEPHVTMTQTQYDALATKNDETYYHITEG